MYQQFRLSVHGAAQQTQLFAPLFALIGHRAFLLGQGIGQFGCPVSQLVQFAFGFLPFGQRGGQLLTDVRLSGGMRQLFAGLRQLGLCRDKLPAQTGRFNRGFGQRRN